MYRVKSKVLIIALDWGSSKCLTKKSNLLCSEIIYLFCVVFLANPISKKVCHIKDDQLLFSGFLLFYCVLYIWNVNGLQRHRVQRSYQREELCWGKFHFSLLYEMLHWGSKPYFLDLFTSLCPCCCPHTRLCKLHEEMPLVFVAMPKSCLVVNCLYLPYFFPPFTLLLHLHHQSKLSKYKDLHWHKPVPFFLIIIYFSLKSEHNVSISSLQTNVYLKISKIIDIQLLL